MKLITPLPKLLFLTLLHLSVFAQPEYKNKIISIDGYLGGKVPISSIKKAKEFQLLAPYKLLKATVYFTGGVGTKCVTTTIINSNKFDSSFFEFWKRLDVSSIITLDNIVVVKPDGTTGTLVGTSFFVVKDGSIYP